MESNCARMRPMNERQAINRLRKMKQPDVEALAVAAGIPLSTLMKIKLRFTNAPRKATVSKLLAAISVHQ